MANAAVKDNFLTPRVQHETLFQVLDVIIPTLDACRIRRGIAAACPGSGILRCEPLIHSNASCPSSAPRVRLSIRLPSDSYASVIHSLAENSKSAEIGRLSSWREHLARHCFASGDQVPPRAPKRVLSRDGQECGTVSGEACTEQFMDGSRVTQLRPAGMSAHARQ